MKLQYFNKMMDAILRQVFLMTVSSLTFQIITAIVKECTSKIMLSKRGYLFRLLDRELPDFLRSLLGLFGGVFLGVGTGVLGFRLNLGGGPTKEHEIIRLGETGSRGFQ